MILTDSYASPLGAITLAGDETALTGLWFDGQAYFGDTLPLDRQRGTTPVLEEAKRWLALYFSGQRPDFAPPLRFQTTPFRKAVWELLLTIPYGQTVTYGELARQLGCRSAQAVGGAVGHNPISLIVPCHRVVGAGGTLTGYAGGVDKKQWLLELEANTRDAL